MSPPRIVCRGAPRDLGYDQGAAWRKEIRQRCGSGVLARWLRTVFPSQAERRIRRDTFRFFPHAAERTSALARSAGVPEASLFSASMEPRALPRDSLRLVSSLRGPCVAFAIPQGELALLRESAPDGDFRSLEFTRAWSVAPWVGVNERGLAVGVVFAAAGEVPCAAPAPLLAQECLQRFDRVAAATDWICSRTAGGRCSIALADAERDFACVDVEGAERRVRREIGDPISSHTSAGAWIVAAEPASRTLSWTFADGSVGEASLA